MIRRGKNLEPGRCRICGCTDEKPCRMLPNPDRPIAGQTLVNCEWADHSRISPGISGSATLTVTSPTGTANGFYTIGVSATNAFVTS
jgi:hypothetical protein